MNFQLKTLVTGQDEEGRPITACRVVWEQEEEFESIDLVQQLKLDEYLMIVALDVALRRSDKGKVTVSSEEFASHYAWVKTWWESEERPEPVSYVDLRELVMDALMQDEIVLSKTISAALPGKERDVFNRVRAGLVRKRFIIEKPSGCWVLSDLVPL